MPILDSSELAIYAPEVDLSGMSLVAALASIQLLLEGPQGAQRPLGLTEYNEIKEVRTRVQTVQLSYWPIMDTPEPVLKARTGNVMGRFNRPIPLGDWVDLDSPLDLIDHTGQVNLSRLSRLQGGFTEINAIYTSGLDFSVSTTDADAIEIKRLVGHFLDYQQNDLSALGISSYSADHEGKFTIASPSSSSSGTSGKPNLGSTSDMLNVLLQSVQKYRPRGVI